MKHDSRATAVRSSRSMFMGRKDVFESIRMEKLKVGEVKCL